MESRQPDRHDSYSIMNLDAEAGFLIRLFEQLKKADIRYAVMRNYESLPASTGGSDLDILIAPHQLESAIQATHAAIHAAGGAAIGVAYAVGVVKIQAIGCVDQNDRQWWGLRMDFCPGFRFAGIDLLDVRAKFPVQTYRGISVLPAGLAGVLGVLKEVLNNGCFPERYAADAREAARHDWPGIARLLLPMGAPALARLEWMLTSAAPTDSLGGECRHLTREVLIHAFAHRPVASVKAAIFYQWSKIRRYWKPSGVTVAILGVDGAGKSTLIEAIKPALEAATHHALKVRHLRPNLLPPLGRLKGAAVSAGPVLEPHGKPPSGKLLSLFRLAYLTLDYQLGYWLWTRPQIAKLPNIVLFDRYAYDMALDPRRFRVGLSSRVTGWFARLAPKPDLIFCLHGDPATIAARKGELTVEETARQIRALRDFAESNPRAVLIATDKGIDETRDEVLGTLRDFLRNRQKA